MRQNINVLANSGVLSEVISYETQEIAACASGSTMTTKAGREFIDFTSGVAVHPCGHCHPEIVAAIERQSALVTHTADVMRHDPELLLAARIAALLTTAVPTSWSVLFLNSGSESVDAAAKLAIKATGRTDFFAFDGAFHGRTIFATALSRSKHRHWDAYEPMLTALRPHIYHATSPRAPKSCAASATAIISAHANSLAAVILEPELGEGGYVPFEPETARKIVDAARAVGAVVIVDEVQTGFGRTGKWFGFEHLGIEPDIVVFGKAIGGGLPLAGIAARREIMDCWETGEHGTTFGGNPVACAAGLAALAVIERDDLHAAANRIGAEMHRRFEPLVETRIISDVRGWGAMIGVELRDDNGQPDYDRCSRVKAAAFDSGLLILTCGAKIGDPVADTAALRLIPALNIPSEQLTEGLDILVQVLSA